MDESVLKDFYVYISVVAVYLNTIGYV